MCPTRLVRADRRPTRMRRRLPSGGWRSGRSSPGGRRQVGGYHGAKSQTEFAAEEQRPVRMSDGRHFSGTDPGTELEGIGGNYLVLEVTGRTGCGLRPGHETAGENDETPCVAGGFAPSGRPDSNRRPSPWQGDALPTEPRPRGRSLYRAGSAATNQIESGPGWRPQPPLRWRMRWAISTARARSAIWSTTC